MKTSKKLNRNRSLRIESLEERELLAVYTVNDLSDNMDVGYDSDIGYYYENPDTSQKIAAGTRMNLRMAILQANRTTADDTINIAVAGTIYNTGRFNYTSNYYIGGEYINPGLLTINGNNVTINASQQVGVMFFSNANLTLSNMTITGSANGTYTIQHAVAYDEATMTLNNVTLKNNDSWYDVIRIESESKMFLNKCTITDNLATGVGNNGGTLTINDCTITNNTREGGPGGISTSSYSMTTIHSSVIAGNSCTGDGARSGGGIYVGLSNTVNIYNSLIVGNYSADGAGGIHQLGGSLKIVNSTIAGNYGTDASGVCSYSTIEMRNTIVSRNIGTNCWYRDYNYTGSNNLVDTDPKFVKYSSYSTWTKDLWKSWNLHLQSSSPAINKGSNSYTAGVTTDLDGKTRVLGGTVDIGAYEYVGSTPTTVGTPTNFKAVQSGKNVVLTWSAASNAKTYRISRWNDVTKKWVDLSKACTKLTLTNSNVSPGTHKYLLRAYNGNSYGNSVTVSINVKGTTTTVGTPTNFKAVQNGKNVVLTWSAASNAATYRIGRWNDVTKKWVDLSKACTKLTLTNTNVSPGTHKYLLRAYNGTSYGNSVTVSINVKGTTTTVGTPTNFKAVQSGKNVVLTWSAASNATTYRIGRWNDVTKKWVDLSKSCTKLTLTNSNVTPGTHKYLLRAYNGTSYGNSVTVSITVKGTTAAVGTPTNFKAVQSGKNVVLTWSAASNAATYRIGRWNDVTKKWVDLSKACTKLTLTNTNVTPGTHKYLLRAYNGTLYGNSVTVSITVKRTASASVETALGPLEAVFAEYSAEYENV